MEVTDPAPLLIHQDEGGKAPKKAKKTKKMRHLFLYGCVLLFVGGGTAALHRNKKKNGKKDYLDLGTPISSASAFSDTLRQDATAALWPRSGAGSSSSSSSSTGSGDVKGVVEPTTCGKPCKAQLTKRLVPRSVDLVEPESVAPLKQFFHLHHMKTGGTSMNSLMRCALDRHRKASGKNTTITFSSLSECSGSYFKRCMDGDESCKKMIDGAAVMSYCAPLRAVDQFGWGGVDSFTVIRHPVDRVWSMYRFQTKSCYGCRKLSEIYEEYDAGKTNVSNFRGICLPQLMNHQTTNLLSTTESLTETHDAQMSEAIRNVKFGFTLIGLTNELPTTAKMVGKVFPWMAEADPWANPEDTTSTVTTTTVTTTTITSGTTKHNYKRSPPHGNTECPLPHSNASPQNNRCGPDGTHMPLPDEPDEHTRQLILQHNRQDMAVYEAAVKMFELQRQILDIDDA